MNNVIKKSIFLPVSPDIVWQYLSDAKKLGEWFHPSDTDMVAGAEYTLTSQKDGDRMCWGRVEEATPNDYMKWSFTVGPANGEMSTVEWILENAPGGTKLSLAHSGLPESTEGFGLLLALDKGWHGFLLALREATE